MFDAGQCYSQGSVLEESLRLYIYIVEEIRQLHLLTVAIFKLSLTCILSASFSGTGSALSRYASKPGG